MDRYAILINPREEMIKLLLRGDTMELEEMQRLVRGYIEIVPSVLGCSWAKEGEDVGIVFVINEEGKLMNLPVNELATDMSAVYNDVIVGNALMMLTKGDELIGLTEEAADNIIEKWGKGE